MAELKFEIIKHIGTLHSRQFQKSGLTEVWSLEMNIVSWNNNVPKLDIREWSEDYKRMSKGITIPLEDTERMAMYLHNYVAERSNNEK